MNMRLFFLSLLSISFFAVAPLAGWTQQEVEAIKKMDKTLQRAPVKQAPSQTKEQKAADEARKKRYIESLKKGKVK